MPCGNGGSCVSVPNAAHLYECRCKPGYSGKSMSAMTSDDEYSMGLFVMMCIQSSCMHTRCYMYMYVRLNGAAGKNCEVMASTNPCERVRCHAGGSCFPINDHEFYCSCLNGRYGDTCQHSTSRVQIYVINVPVLL